MWVLTDDVTDYVISGCRIFDNGQGVELAGTSLALVLVFALALALALALVSAVALAVALALAVCIESL